MLKIVVFFLLVAGSSGWMRGNTQRLYAPHSALASGNWVKIGVGAGEGVYKVDVNMLAALGVNTNNLPSASIRLFGNGGGMLAENNAAARIDDLFENAISMMDGGDGVFDGNDYFLFYAPGTSRWEKDSLGQRFIHHKNIYGDTAFYYISIGGTGKRIQTKIITASPTVSVSSYNERYFHETDLVNLLSSGKEWYGEEFSNNPVINLSRSFSVDWPGLLTNQPVSIATDFAGRSVGSAGNFSVQVNGQQVQTVNLPAVSGNFLDLFATHASQQNSFTAVSSPLTISFTYTAAAPGAQGWLNWFELNGRRNLAVNGSSQLLFRDWSSVGTGVVAAFTIGNSSNAAVVWDVTDPLQPGNMTTTFNGSQINFTSDASRLREYVVFNSNNVLLPVALGKVDRQDLHGGTFPADYIIITHPSLLPEAKRLAQFHAGRDGLKPVVVTTDQVFNEFAGGLADPAAIRDFVKMYFDKAGADSTLRPKYLLLFGSASYDYRFRVKGNTNLVPGYESINSLDPLNSYTSDDFFGLLDDKDDINQNTSPGMQAIGVGRIPARTLAEAKTMVDKIIHYYDTASLGAWRNQMVFVADDRDNNLHLNDAESISVDARSANALLNQQKIYLDAYPLVSGSAGARYPAVNEAIVNRLFNGALIFNYSGHGSYLRLAEEAVLTQDELNRLQNPHKLPLFITASCDFDPYDDPLKNSLGGAALTGSANGAIALLSTTRLVFAFSNRIINDNYLKIALQPAANGQYLSLGESVRRAKNITATGFGDVLNTRKFALLGDPALRLAFPQYQLQLTGLNNKPLSDNDTLKALVEYNFTGIVTNASGGIIVDFNGLVYPTVFDKAQVVKTLGNDVTSPVTGFLQQANVLYKGNASVKNGRFSFSFIMPKDISFQAGKGRISLYASDGLRDAGGVYERAYIGGAGNNVNNDLAGPMIKAFLNDDKFMNGGLTHENPLLLVKLYDSLGISTSGNGIGHDITAVIDGNEKNVLVLNDFYTALTDSYRQGQVLFPLPALSAGPHRITIKAWDVADHSSVVRLDFVVAKQDRLQVSNLRNFPNPFTTYTTFSFEHNQPNTDLDVSLAIYALNGMLVKRIRQTVHTGGTRNCQINWDGMDEHGRKLEKGIYIYRIMVSTGDNQVEAARQLILF